MWKACIFLTVLCTLANIVRHSFIPKMQEMSMFQEIIKMKINAKVKWNTIFFFECRPVRFIKFWSSGGEPDRSILHEYIKKEIINGRSISVCTMCGKSNSQKQNLLNHVESVHFPNMFTYNCKYCGKTYNAKNSLYVHMSTSHRDQKSSF